MFKGLSSHILSSVFGLSVVTAGGYGAVTLLRKEVKEDNSFLKWYEGDSEKVSEITFAEYIVKGQSNGEGQVCGRWEKGKTKFLDSNNCSKRIKEKWEYSLSKQPEVWFKATEEDMEKALSIHFSNETWTVEVKKVGNDWEVGPMKCSKSSSSVEDLDKKYVEASCSHKDEDSKNPN